MSKSGREVRWYMNLSQNLLEFAIDNKVPFTWIVTVVTKTLLAFSDGTGSQQLLKIQSKNKYSTNSE